MGKEHGVSPEPLSGVWVCAGWGLSVKMGAGEVSGNQVTRASKAAVGGVGILKTGQRKDQICVFLRASEEAGTEGSTLMCLTGKGVSKCQNAWWGLWDSGRKQDIHAFICSSIQHVFSEVQLCAGAQAACWRCPGDKTISSCKMNR